MVARLDCEGGWMSCDLLCQAGGAVLNTIAEQYIKHIIKLFSS